MPAPALRSDQRCASCAPRQCPLEAAGGQAPPDAAALMAAAAECTALSRNLEPLQSNACQPLGAWHCAAGFQQCWPRIHGGEDCIHHFDRFLEHQGRPTGAAPPPAPAAAAESHRIEAIFDTCLSGDAPPAAEPGRRHLAVAATPSFVGNHSDGWDAMFAALIRALKPAELPLTHSDSLNLVMGFEHFAENYRILRHLLEGFELRIQFLSDPSALLDGAPSAADSAGGTRLETLRAAPGALETLLVRPWQLGRSREVIREHWGHDAHPLPVPIGLAWTDAWVQQMARISGREVPALLQLQRHQLCEAIHHALPLLCRQRFAVYGEPDFVMGISRFLVELGAGPALILCQNGDRHWLEAMEGLLADCEYQREVAVHIGTPPAAVDSLLREHRPDLLLAPPALRQHDLAPQGLPGGVKRVQLERPSGPGDQPSTFGYAGARHLLNTIIDAAVRDT